MRARAKIRALEQENGKLREIIASLQEEVAIVASLREEVESLKGIVRELREQLRTNSRNSSKPPSSDPPSSDPPTCFDNGRDGKHKPKGRRRGGQPGHEGKTRKLFGPDQVNQVIDCAPPERCECGGRVRPVEVDPERRQKLDIPPIKPVITEYRLFTGLCDTCGRRHRGILPEGVDNGLLCSRPMAMAALLSGKYHLSKRNVVVLTVCGTCKRQGRNVLDYLTQAIEASLLGQSAPSLLPTEAPRNVSAA